MQLVYRYSAEEETAWTTPHALVTAMMLQYPEAATWTVMAMVRMRAAAGSQLSANKRLFGGGGGFINSSSCVHCGAFPPRMPVGYVTWWGCTR
jgi:hypothetical protein